MPISSLHASSIHPSLFRIKPATEPSPPSSFHVLPVAFVPIQISGWQLFPFQFTIFPFLWWSETIKKLFHLFAAWTRKCVFEEVFNSHSIVFHSLSINPATLLFPHYWPSSPTSSCSVHGSTMFPFLWRIDTIDESVPPCADFRSLRSRWSDSEVIFSSKLTVGPLPSIATLLC